MMKKIIVAWLPFFILSFASCKGPDQKWTKAREADLVNEIYQNAKVFKDTVQRKQFALFMVDKLKAELPEGLSNVSKDSLEKIYKKIALMYGRTHADDDLHMVIKWTAEGEQTLRKTLFNSDIIKYATNKVRNKYCDCLVSEIKKLSPDSLTIPIDDSIYKSVVKKCKVGLANP